MVLRACCVTENGQFRGIERATATDGQTASDLAMVSSIVKCDSNTLKWFSQSALRKMFKENVIDVEAI